MLVCPEMFGDVCRFSEVCRLVDWQEKSLNFDSCLKKKQFPLKCSINGSSHRSWANYETAWQHKIREKVHSLQSMFYHESALEVNNKVNPILWGIWKRCRDGKKGVKLVFFFFKYLQNILWSYCSMGKNLITKFSSIEAHNAWKFCRPSFSLLFMYWILFLFFGRFVCYSSYKRKWASEGHNFLWGSQGDSVENPNPFAKKLVSICSHHVDPPRAHCWTSHLCLVRALWSAFS